MSLRSTLAKLKKLLLARDPAAILQGVELAAALGDPEVFAALLEGVTWDPQRHRPGRWDRGHGVWGGLVPNRIFQGTGPAQPFHDLAMTLLLARAPEHPAKGQVDRLKLGAWDRKRPMEALPLHGIGGLPALRELFLASRGTVGPLAPLADAPALEALELRVRGAVDLTGLGGCRRLRRLHVRGELVSTAGVEGAPLEDLYIHSRHLRDLRGLEGAPLRQVRLAGSGAVDLSALGGAEMELLDTVSITLERLRGPGPRSLRVVGHDAPLHLPTMSRLEELTLDPGDAPLTSDVQPSLRAVQIRRTASLPAVAQSWPATTTLQIDEFTGSDLASLTDARSLETLHIAGFFVRDASALGTLVGLKHLSLGRLPGLADLDQLPEARLAHKVHGAGIQPTDTLSLGGSIRSARAIGRLRGLVQLSLQGGREVHTLEGFEAARELRVLDLRGCASLSDLSPLADLPELRLVAIRDSAVDPEQVPASIRWTLSTAARPDLTAARTRKKPTSAPKTKAAKPFDRVKHLLASKEAERVQEGVDLALELGDPKIIDRLLKAVSDDAASVRGHMSRIGGIGNRRLALQRLVGGAPPASREAARIGAGVRRWTRGHHEHKESYLRDPGPVDLRGIAGFTALEHLTLDRTDALLHADELAQLPKLERLTLDYSPLPMAALPRLEALRALRLSDTPDDLPALQAPNLVDLHIPGVDPTAADFLAGLPLTDLFTRRWEGAPHPTIERLTYYAYAPLAPGLLAGMPRLDALRLHAGAPLSHITDLRCLEGTAVTSVGLTVIQGGFSFAGLPPSVKTLELSFYGDVELTDWEVFEGNEAVLSFRRFERSVQVPGWLQGRVRTP